MLGADDRLDLLLLDLVTDFEPLFAEAGTMSNIKDRPASKRSLLTFFCVIRVNIIVLLSLAFLGRCCVN